MKIVEFIIAALMLASARRRERKDTAERGAIAKAFNDRWTYRHRYGDAYHTNEKPNSMAAASVADPGEHAWMCPKCNRVHLSIGCSFLTGLWYPACCDHPEGHRLFDKIRIS